MDASAIQIGALAPLTPPGWAEAGRHLLAGLEQGVRDVNDAGGIDGRPLELVVRDTAADPSKAAAAVDELAGLGVVALAGEFHSVVARAVAARADALGVPFLCSSAVLDALTDEPTEWVARLCPPQSRGWNVYADFLLANGHRRIAVATQPSAYWAAGIRVLRNRLAVVELATADPDDVGEAVLGTEATALLLLVGHPEPATKIVTAVRSDRRLRRVMIGAPAGQPELPGWEARLGADGAAIPFLRYRLERLTPLGARVERGLRDRLGQNPCFVAFEGYDAIAVLADLLRQDGSWSRVAVDGTRGRIRFSRPPGSRVWQWAWPPIQVADRDPARPDRFRVLYTGDPEPPL
ncbi:MAG TPA: ABC transporter substrate-binding protein [Solirubrobacteraceae bacterium]|jgi:ABC-type branched-subunit amino acid transport system substrate-binding protein